jgi:adenosine deaminase
VCAHVAPSIAEHQVGTLLDTDVMVTINTDDPPMFATTLTGEYRRVAGAFGLGIRELTGQWGTPSRRHSWRTGTRWSCWMRSPR